jgi:hypothetical protein
MCASGSPTRVRRHNCERVAQAVAENWRPKAPSRDKESATENHAGKCAVKNASRFFVKVAEAKKHTQENQGGPVGRKRPAHGVRGPAKEKGTVADFLDVMTTNNGSSEQDFAGGEAAGER